MKRIRFQYGLGVCIVGAGLSVPCAWAQQQPFPSKPVRVLISAAAGTGLDASTRLIAPKLSEY